MDNGDMVFLPIVFPTSSSMTISWDIYASGWSFDTIFPTQSGAPLAPTNLVINGTALSWRNNEPLAHAIYLDRATNSGFTLNVVSEVLPPGSAFL